MISFENGRPIRFAGDFFPLIAWVFLSSFTSIQSCRLSTIYKLPLLAIHKRIHLKCGTHKVTQNRFFLFFFFRIREKILLLIFMSFPLVSFPFFSCSLGRDLFRFIIIFSFEIYSNWNGFNGIDAYEGAGKNGRWNIYIIEWNERKSEYKCWSISWDLILLRWTVWQILHHFVFVLPGKVIPLMPFHSIHI